MKPRKKETIYMDNLHDTLKKKISKKKIAVVLIIAILIITIIVLVSIYSLNENFRKTIDQYISFKNVEENNVPYINLENTNASQIFAWSNNIGVISGNNFTKYDSIGKDIANITIEISDPLIAVNNDYAVIAEKDGNKIYLLKKNDIAWEKNIEGKISRINVNQNGYVSVVIEETIYKSVIELYDNNGEEVLKTYLSSTIAVNVDVSKDNKYLAFAEINISGTMVQSNVKIVSIENSKEKKSNSDSIIYTYNAEPNSVIIDIQYQNKNKLMCRYDDSVHVIYDDKDEKIIDLDNNNSFADIKLDNYIVYTKEKSVDLLKNDTEVNFVNINNKKVNTYNFTGTIKNLYVSYDKVGINTGKEIHFVGTNGWLIKKYKAKDDIKDIVMNNSLAGIIYKNKIEIINL